MLRELMKSKCTTQRNWSRNSPHLMEPQDLLPYKRHSFTGFCPEPVGPSPHPHTFF